MNYWMTSQYTSLTTEIAGPLLLVYQERAELKLFY